MRRSVIKCSVLIALTGPCCAAAPEPVQVNVTLSDYQFSPDHLTLEHAVHYRFHLENHGKETHEFTAPTFFGTVQLDNPAALNREHTEVVMQPGESKDIFLTPGAPGTYDLRCSDHDWAGMVSGITVR